jgi:hypothetical protein
MAYLHSYLFPSSIPLDPTPCKSSYNPAVTLLAMTFFKQLNQLRRSGNQPVSHIYQASLPSSLAFSAVLHTITACTASPCPLHITSLSHPPAIARELDSLQCAALQALGPASLAMSHSIGLSVILPWKSVLTYRGRDTGRAPGAPCEAMCATKGYSRPL